ncbi:MAG: hypothetical protein VKI83_00395 [Synechococcaceae cyanobacterium]|nr:hypothetical protein [Synechococcaceae cyanobacterium]
MEGISAARPQVVYCLTSDGDDLYAAMTQVSAATLRLTNPGAVIRVVVDPASAAALRSQRHGLLELLDGLEERPVPEGFAATARNRWLKTQLRLLLEGPFLFLDSDTVVREPIGGLIPSGAAADLAAAANNSQEEPAQQIWEDDADALRRLGWSEPLRALAAAAAPAASGMPAALPYCNGGVLGYADSPGAHAFARCWHQLWLEGLERLGRPRDQPALNTAIQRSGVRLQPLPARCNAQYKANLAVLRDAAIWHSYASFGEAPLTLFLACALRVQQGKRLGPGLLQRLVHNWHPWMRNRPGHDRIVRRALRRGGFSRREQLWMGGQYRQALWPGRA